MGIKNQIGSILNKNNKNILPERLRRSGKPAA